METHRAATWLPVHAFTRHYSLEASLRVNAQVGRASPSIFVQGNSISLLQRVEKLADHHEWYPRRQELVEERVVT